MKFATVKYLFRVPWQ